MTLALETLGTIILGASTYCGALYALWGFARRPAGLETMVAQRLILLFRYVRRSPITEVS